MKYTTLPRTDLRVSKICLGTMTFGRQNTEAEGHEQMDLAVERGVNFFDTAELYAVPSGKPYQGLTEQYIGTWLQKRAKRDDLIIATKIVGYSPNLTYIRPELNFKPESLQVAVEGSLRRLQTDYIDLYQLHWPTRRTNYFGKRGYKHDPTDPWEDNFLEVLNGLNDLVKSGKIRHFGISNETPWGTMRLLQLAEKHDLPRFRTIQNPYSLLNRTYEVGMAEISMREEVPLIPYSPLAGGMLSGKYHLKADKPESRFNQFKSFMPRYQGEEARLAVKRYLELAQANNLSLTQMALAFVNQQTFVASNIIGATNLEQLAENIDSIHIALGDDILKEIERIQELCPNPAP